MKYKKKTVKSKSNKRIYKDQYLDQLNEWQEHQYDPGYYTGAKVPPIVSNPGRPFVLGWFLVISSIIFSVLILLVIFMYFDKKQILPIVIVILLVVGLSTIQFIAGIRLIQKGRLINKGKDHTHKKIIFSLTIFFMSVLLIFGIYYANNNYEQITITSMEEVKLKQVEDNNLVYIKNVNKTLNCSYEDYGTLWSFDISYSLNNKDTSFKLEYVWNNFFPKKGKIIKITK